MEFPSAQEETIIRNHVILPLLITVLERDKKVIQESALKIKNPYINLLDSCIKKVEHAITNNRKSLRLYGIKIYQEIRTDKGIEVKYLYKGYHHKCNPCWDVLRNMVTDIMWEYLSR